MYYDSWDTTRNRPGVRVDCLVLRAALEAHERELAFRARRCQTSAQREAARARMAVEDALLERCELSAFYDADARRLYALAAQREADARAWDARLAVSEWSRARAALDAFRLAYGNQYAPGVPVCIIETLLQSGSAQVGP